MYVYTVEYLSSKKDKTLPFVTTCKELESIVLSETSDGERQISHDFTHTLKKNKQNPTINTPSNQRTNKIKHKRTHRTG